MQDLSNYPQLHSVENTDTGKFRQAYRVMVSGFYLDEFLNVEEILKNNVNSTQTTYQTTGDFGGFEGYVVIENEIIEVTSSIYDGITTSFVVKRGQLNTKPASHIAGCIIRSVQDFTSRVINYTVTEETESTYTRLFSPVVSSGDIEFVGDTRFWAQYNPQKKYNVNRKNVVYIFEGAFSEIICRHICFVDDYSLNNKTSRIDLTLKDKFIYYFNELIPVIKSYKDVTIKELLSDLLDININRIVYANNLNDSDFKRVDEINTKDYETYDALFSDLSSQLAVRFYFNSREELVLYSDIVNTDPQSNILIDQDLLLDINEISENQLVINQLGGTYKRKRGFYNINDFPSPIVYLETFQTSATLVSQNENGKYYYNIIENMNAGVSVRYLKIGSYVKLKDNILGDEFFGYVVKVNENFDNISLSTIDVIMGFDKDSIYSYFGLLDYLAATYQTSRTFTVYVGRNELPFVWEYGIGDKTTNINYPLLPSETLELQGSFGGLETADEKFTGIIENLDIFDVTYDNTDLLYQKEMSQTIPIYVRSQKQGVSGTGDNQRTIYTDFDNSNLTVRFERDSSADFNCFIKNTLSGGIVGTVLPENVIGINMEISTFTEFNSITTGDVFLLKDTEQNKDSNRINVYNSYKGERWVVQGKYTDPVTGQFILLFDKNLVLGANNFQMYFDRYSYSSIILLQELNIRGNPVIESTENINWENAESIIKYGKKNYAMEGSFIKEEDVNTLANYITNGFAGTELNNTKFIIPIKLMNNYSIEPLDVISISDNIYTGLNNQKAVVTKMSTTNNRGVVFQEYEVLTINDYDNTADIVLKSNFVYQPLNATEYNHNGNESITEGVQRNADDQIVKQFDPVFGEVTLLKINQQNFTAECANTVISGNRKLEIKNITGLDQANLEELLLYQGKELFVKINGEFIYCTSTKDPLENMGELNLTQRAMFDTVEQQIKIDDNIEFYKIISFSNADGFYTVEMLAGDRNRAYIEVKDGDVNIKGNITITAGETYDQLQRINKTFVSDYALFTPTPPYNEGDIWILYNSDNFKVCVNSKEEGEDYSSADWADATSIDTTVDSLTTDLNLLDQNIQEYNDDNKITITEAKSIEKQFLQIQSESEELILQATTVKNAVEDVTLKNSINVAINNYQTSVSTLSSYLNFYYIKKTGEKFNESFYPLSISDYIKTTVNALIEDTQTKKEALSSLLSEGQAKIVDESLQPQINAQEIRIQQNEGILDPTTGILTYGDLKIGAQGVNTASGAGLSFVGGQSLFKIDSVNNFVDLLTVGDISLGTFQSGYYPNRVNLNNENKSYIHLNVGSTGDTSNILQLGQTTSNNFLVYNTSGITLQGDLNLTGTNNVINFGNSYVSNSGGYFSLFDSGGNRRIYMPAFGTSTEFRLGTNSTTSNNFILGVEPSATRKATLSYGFYNSSAEYIYATKLYPEYGLRLPNSATGGDLKGSIYIDNSGNLQVHNGSFYQEFSGGFTGTQTFKDGLDVVKTMNIENGLIKSIT